MESRKQPHLLSNNDWERAFLSDMYIYIVYDRSKHYSKGAVYSLKTMIIEA